MTVSELIGILSEMPQDKEVYAGFHSEYPPCYKPITSAEFGEHEIGIRLTAGNETTKEVTPHEDRTVQEFINLLSNAPMDIPVRAIYVENKGGRKCHIGGIFMSGRGDTAVLNIEVGTAAALKEVERPYITVLPYCEWEYDKEFVGIELSANYAPKEATNNGTH